MLTGDRRPTRDLHGQRHAGARRHRRGPRARPPRPRRPVRHRLRRHRGRRLRRADDGPPAAVRVRPPRRRDPAGRDRLPLRGAARRPPGARARGPRDHGASEGGPWMRTRERRWQPARNNEEERSWSAFARPGASARRCPEAALAASPSRSSWSAACAAPGAVSTPSPPRRAAPSRRPSAAGSSAAPSESAGRGGPDCGTDPVELNAYFETGFDLPFKLSDEFTKQFPNVTWKISQDQFTNLMTADAAAAVGRQPARPDPAAVDGVPRQGRPAEEPRRLRRRRSAGTSSRPAQLAQNRVEYRRDARLRFALRGGPELQPDRRLLQQEARRSRSA